MDWISETIRDMYRLKKWSVNDLKENYMYVALCIDFFLSDNEIIYIL